MPTIIENINNIISTKSELKTILTENGLEPSENFNEYPDMFRSIVGGGSIDEAALNGYISSYLDTYSFIDQTALSSNSYITEVVFNNGTGGFITSIQNSDSGGQHIILYNRGEAITPSVLASCGYITSADVPAVDENIIPKENNTYNLGDASHLYAASYVSDMWLNSNNRFSNRSNNQINLQLNGSWRYTFHVNNFGPAVDNTRDLGESSVKWRSTYTSNIYADNAYISNYNNLIWTGTSAEYAALADYTTYQIYLIQEA